MKDYDAIARELNLRMPCEVKGHENDCPHPHVQCSECCERRKIARDAAILRKHDEAEAGGEPGDGYWWCPECREAVDGHEVTFQEYHERCGTKVIAKAARPAPTDEKGLREALQRMTNRSNRITCPFRHEHDVRAIRADDIESLYEAQLEAESLLAHEAPKDDTARNVDGTSYNGIPGASATSAPKDESKEGGA